jgi:hypothetical protein
LKLVLEGKIEERNFQKRKKKKRTAQDYMGRMQREITKRLVGHDSESRHVFLQLHATGSTVVSGDYLLISFR